MISAIVLVLVLLIALVYGIMKLFPQQWMALKNLYATYVIGTSVYIIFTIADKLCYFQNVLKNPQARDGHIAVVTGGGRGIGLEVVKGLMRSGMTVIMGVRNPESCKHLLGDLMKNYPKGRVSTIKLDLSSMKSVREFVRQFTEKYSKLHILVNNAGILHGEYKKTEDGFDEKLATNYLGHFLLTHLLTERLKTAGKDCEMFSRVVNVSSCAHVSSQVNWDDLNMEKDYCFATAYTQSKLLQLMFSHRLDKSFVYYDMPVRSIAVNPGIVGSEMFISVLNTIGSWALRLNSIVKTPKQGAVSVLHACLSPTLERQGGNYISNCGEGYSNAQSKSRMDQDRLFKQTMAMLGIQQFGIPVGYYTMANLAINKSEADDITAYSL